MSVRRVLGAGLLIGALASVAAAQPRVTGDVEAGRRKAEACVACHGPNGNSTRPDVPSLAGQPPLYTYYQLFQFREGRRVDPQMSAFAANLSDADMQDLALYLATERPVPPRDASDPAKAEAGRRVSVAQYCGSCHLPDLSGQNHIPRLTALSYDYLVRQLRGYKAQTRADYDGHMTVATQPLTEQDIENLAHYILRLAAATGP